MRLSFILLAGGNSSRFKSNIPKPYQKIAGKTLIELSINKIRQFKQFKKIIIVLFFLLGIIVYHSVSKAVRHKDMKYISIYLKGIDLPEDPQDLSY